MSSALLKKRIMLNIEAGDIEGKSVSQTNLNQISQDCSPPINKLFVGSESTEDIFDGISENVDLANDLSNNTGQTAQSKTICTGTDLYPGCTDSKVKTKKVWMASRATKREPRIGTDYQALIE